MYMDYRTNGTERRASPFNCENIDADTQKLNIGEETQLLEGPFDSLLDAEEGTQVVEDDSNLESDDGTECTIVISGDDGDPDDHLTDIESARLPNVFPSNEQSVSGASTKTTAPQKSTEADFATPKIFSSDDPEIKTFDFACGIRDDADKPNVPNDDSLANRDELISTNDKPFGLSYANSEEPGEETQENALYCVQKLLADSDILLNNESASPKIFNGGNTPVNSAVKGPQCLARIANVSNNLGSGGVYEWDDRFEDEGGGEILTRRKDEFFGVTKKTSKKQNTMKSNGGGGGVDSRKRVTLEISVEDLGRSSMADVGVNSQVAMESLAKGNPNLLKNSVKMSLRRRRASPSEEGKKTTEMSLRSLRTRAGRQKSSAKKLLKDKEPKNKKDIVHNPEQSSRGKHFKKDLMLSEPKGVVTRSKRAKYDIKQDATKTVIDHKKETDETGKKLVCKGDESEETRCEHSSVATIISEGDAMVSPVAKRTRRSMRQLSVMLNTPEIATMKNTITLNGDGSFVNPKSISTRKGPQRTEKCEDSREAKRSRRVRKLMQNTPKMVAVENTSSPPIDSDFFVVTTSVPKRKGSQRTKKGDSSSKQHSAKDSSNADASEKVTMSSGKRGSSLKNSKIITSNLISKDPERMSSPASNIISESELLTSSQDRKDSRKRKDLSSVRVVFSHHLDDDIIQQQKKLIERLGISTASSISKATHFVADQFIRTKNMLEAIAYGKQIVTHQWLQHVAQANYYIDEKNYVLRDVKKEKELGFNMSLTLEHSRHNNLLKGLKAFVSPNAKPNKATVSTLVNADCGKVLEEVEKAMLNDPAFSDNLLVLSCEEDYDICLPFLERGVAVYSSELVLNGILTRKLEFDRYRLFSGQSKRTRVLRSGNRSQRG